MRLKKEQIERLAEKVVADLERAELLKLKSARKEIVEGVIKVISDDIKKEEELEDEAERILEQSLRAAGGGSGIDRHKMLRMIKEKLAKERKIVL